MPRGQYDRSHLKAKRAAVKAAKSAGIATVAAGIAVSKAGATDKADRATNQYSPPAGYGDMGQLREQLMVLTETRSRLCGTPVAHNESLIGLIDGEATNIIKAMASWRESLFPITVPAETAAAPAKAAAFKTAPLPAPAPVLGGNSGPPPAPLPFTPQAVQEALKSAGQAS